MLKVLARVLFVLLTIIATYYFVYWLPLSLIREFLPPIPWLNNIISLCIALFAGWFIWKKTANQVRGLVTVISISAMSVGSLGFIFGFFDPIIFVPESNQGPLLGLFITGPLGVLLGVFIGWIYWLIRMGSKGDQVTQE